MAEVLDPSDPARPLNLRQVEDGAAVVYRAYCNDRRYLEAEARARTAGRGVWAVAGDWQRPGEYRHRE